MNVWSSATSPKYLMGVLSNRCTRGSAQAVRRSQLDWGYCPRIPEFEEVLGAGRNLGVAVNLVRVFIDLVVGR